MDGGACTRRARLDTRAVSPQATATPPRTAVRAGDLYAGTHLETAGLDVVLHAAGGEAGPGGSARRPAGAA
jgi:hypothetical protein